MQLPISIALNISRRLIGIIVLSHGAILVLYAIILVPMELKWLVWSGVTISLITYLYTLLGMRRVVGLILRRDGLFEVRRHNGEVVALCVHRDTTVTPNWILLVSCMKRSRTTLPILPDTMARDDYRDLSLWLRWYVVIENEPGMYS